MTLSGLNSFLKSRLKEQIKKIKTRPSNSKLRQKTEKKEVPELLKVCIEEKISAEYIKFIVKWMNIYCSQTNNAVEKRERDKLNFKISG